MVLSSPKLNLLFIWLTLLEGVEKGVQVPLKVTWLRHWLETNPYQALALWSELPAHVKMADSLYI